jgi:hypothetical protein
MSQHDYVISDEDGATFLADLNALALAIVGLNSGATAPSTTYPYMFWADTSSDTLKMRNAADDAWINKGTLSTAIANLTLASQAEAQAGSDNTKYMSPLRVLQAINTQTDTFTTAGTAPNFTLTPTKAITAYTAGTTKFRVKFSADGTTGSNVLNISAQGNKNLKQYDSSGAKVDAVVKSGQLAIVEYDGTDLVILNPLPSSILKTALSSAYTASGGETLTAAHGLSFTPSSCRLIFECISADANYSVGDRVSISAVWNGSTIYPIVTFVDSTNCNFKAFSGYYVSIINKTTGATVTPTATKWKWYFEAVL